MLWDLSSRGICVSGVLSTHLLRGWFGNPTCLPQKHDWCYVLVCKDLSYFVDVNYSGRLGNPTRHCCLVKVATSSKIQQKLQHTAWWKITVCPDSIPLRTPLIIVRCHQVDFLLCVMNRKTIVFPRCTRLSSAFIMVNDCSSPWSVYRN